MAIIKFTQKQLTFNVNDGGTLKLMPKNGKKRDDNQIQQIPCKSTTQH